MESYSTTTYKERQPRGQDPADCADIESAERRLTLLLELNRELENGKDRQPFFPSGEGVSYERSYSFLGLLLGIFPVEAFFVKAASTAMPREFTAILVVSIVVIFVSSVVGLFSGRLVGRIMSEMSETRWPVMLAALPFIGVTWGLITGGAGGGVIFLIGAIPGAIIGGLVGAVALTLFGITHRLLSKADEISARHLYPAAIGISSLIAAAILGFPVS